MEMKGGNEKLAVHYWIEIIIDCVRKIFTIHLKCAINDKPKQKKNWSSWMGQRDDWQKWILIFRNIGWYLETWCYLLTCHLLLHFPQLLLLQADFQWQNICPCVAGYLFSICCFHFVPVPFFKALTFVGLSFSILQIMIKPLLFLFFFILPFSFPMDSIFCSVSLECNIPLYSIEFFDDTLDVD